VIDGAAAGRKEIEGEEMRGRIKMQIAHFMLRGFVAGGTAG
jgi:hypothetical protein